MSNTPLADQVLKPPAPEPEKPAPAGKWWQPLASQTFAQAAKTRAVMENDAKNQEELDQSNT